MIGTRNRQLALLEYKIIPDILPENLDLFFDLTLKWPEAILDAPGKQLDREKTQTEPEIFLNPPVSKPI